MILGLVLGALVVATVLLFFQPPTWFPASITLFGQQYDRQFSLTLWVSGLIFLSSHVLLILLFTRFRRKTPHPRWELIWTMLAAVIFFGLAWTGTRIWAGVRNELNPPEAERIQVLAYQFAWSFRYPGPDGVFGRVSNSRVNDAAGNPFGLDPRDPASADDIISATLKVPAGREVILTLQARDVIHDFFVRELRLKQDAVPGMDIPYRFRPEIPGTYEIACSELCGLGHSQMRSTMEVMEPRAYEQWKRSRR